MPKVTFTEQSFLKRSSADSTTLTSGDKLAVGPGKELLITDSEPADNGNVKLYLAGTSWGAVGFTHASHIDGIEGNVEDNEPKDKPTTNVALRKKKKSYIVTNVPGISRLDMFEPVHAEDAPNIFWYELLHFNGTTFRCPESKQITYNLIKLAKELQLIRNRYGSTLTINSGYRDSVTNRRVGGASRSEHVVGGAADFVIAGTHPKQVYADLNAGWGKPLASSSVFTHIGVTRLWRARWSYGF